VEDDGFLLTIEASQHLIRLVVSPGEEIAGSFIVRQNEVQFTQKPGSPGVVRHSVNLCWCALSLRKLRAILPKWFLPTRLVTRTKESNIYASVLVEKPTRTINVIDAKLTQQHRPTMILW